ncbi:hypothetical protein CPJ18_04220 [Agrobacterium rosae]|uniref:Uncharacterized protein n=1 Tax=Agrobacterium rosae TaxID=1972867 RepID=A0AAE5VQZ2_9HYPH|nr:hypothetical protein DXM21_08985 [Agrobacterium rosae]KAA3521397.1 hypothetical protein DXM25_08995 [Agrobacterium rosae]MQB48293.1 hypothetical protein [Agrobacterium rosae]POO53441.1 hypothetical protein CPJ18_04220 [Agrobacterium rosae]
MNRNSDEFDKMLELDVQRRQTLEDFFNGPLHRVPLKRAGVNFPYQQTVMSDLHIMFCEDTRNLY